jgi:hypothetical protein
MFLFMAGVLFANLHWTQRFEHATVLTSGTCVNLLSASTEGHGQSCVYTDVTLNTWFFGRQYVLEDGHGTSVTMMPDDVLSYSYASGSTPFTWKTGVAVIAMLVFVLLALIP